MEAVETSMTCKWCKWSSRTHSDKRYLLHMLVEVKIFDY